jgi:hypothetical protein
VKKLLCLLALLLSCAASSFAQDITIYGSGIDIKPEKSEAEILQQTLSSATLSVYRGKMVCEWETKNFDTIFGTLTIKYWGCEFKKVFTCTATVIDRADNDYIALSAGHCVVWADEDNYYVGTNVETKPVLHKVKIIKAEHDDRYDFAIFAFHSFKELGVVKVNTEGGIPKLGTKVLNINFSLGIGKQYNHGEVISEALDGDPVGDDRQRYLVSVGVGPGASGSAIVDSETGEIVGLAEFIFPGTQMATGVIPTGTVLANFMDDDSAGIKPQPAPESVPKPKDTPPTVVQPKHASILDWLISLAMLLMLGLIVRHIIRREYVTRSSRKHFGRS